MSKVKLSIIIPVYNEEDILPTLIDRLKSLKTSLKETHQVKTNEVEIMFVLDQSKDQSFEILKKYCSENKYFRVLNLSKNSGQYISISAGLDHCQGDAAVVIDADLQDPPEMILDMYQKFSEGYDVVYAVREKRKGESIIYLFFTAIFYRLLNSLSGTQVPKNSGEFRLISRRVIDAFKQINERHRYFRGLISWIGFKQIGLPYERDPRFKGTTNYSIKRMLGYALDGITSFSSMPLRITFYVGLLSAGLGFIYALYIIYMKVCLEITGDGWASIATLVLVIGGIQLISIGILGEYIGRVYDESKRRPLYFIQDDITTASKT